MDLYTGQLSSIYGWKCGQKTSNFGVGLYLVQTTHSGLPQLAVIYTRGEIVPDKSVRISSRLHSD